MRSKKEIVDRINELKSNKFYTYSCYSKSLKREIHSAIVELEWVLKIR